MFQECNKCYHQFSNTLSSVAACNCCENGNFFESITKEYEEDTTMRLSDRRRPTCPHCGMAKLETADIIDTYTNYEDNIFVEYTIGTCPNCERTFSYNQIYTLEPTGYDDLIDVTEDEEEDE